MSFLQRREVTIHKVGHSHSEVPPPLVPAAMVSWSQTARAPILALGLQIPWQVIQLLVICEMKRPTDPVIGLP